MGCLRGFKQWAVWGGGGERWHTCREGQHTLLHYKWGCSDTGCFKNKLFLLNLIIILTTLDNKLTQDKKHVCRGKVATLPEVI